MRIVSVGGGPGGLYFAILIGITRGWVDAAAPVIEGAFTALAVAGVAISGYQVW